MNNIDDWFEETEYKIIRICEIFDCEDEATHRLVSLTDLISDYYCEEHTKIEFLLREFFYEGEWRKEGL